MAAGLDHDRKTPGVYVTELSAFTQSVVGVDTAVPIFIGYTETAKDPSTGKPLYLQAVRISSIADYSSCFGGGYPARGLIAPRPATTAPPLPPSTTGIAYDFVAPWSDGTSMDTGSYVVGTAQLPSGAIASTTAISRFAGH